MLEERPSRLIEPRLDLVHAVDIAVATNREELACHQRGEQRFGVLGICPEIHEQQARLRHRARAHAPERLHVLLRIEHVHDICRDKRIVATWNRVAEKVSLDDVHALSRRRVSEVLSRDGSCRRRGLRVGKGFRQRRRDVPDKARVGRPQGEDGREPAHPYAPLARTHPPLFTVSDARYFVGSENSPSISYVTVPSALPVPLAVPFPLMPFSLPVPLANAQVLAMVWGMPSFNVALL